VRVTTWGVPNYKFSRVTFALHEVLSLRVVGPGLCDGVLGGEEDDLLGPDGPDEAELRASEAEEGHARCEDLGAGPCGRSRVVRERKEGGRVSGPPSPPHFG